MADIKKTRDVDIRKRVVASIKGMSISALSKQTEIPRTSISRWFADTQIPAYFCTALIELLSLDGHWLLTGEGKPKLGNSSAQQHRGDSSTSAGMEHSMMMLEKLVQSSPEGVSSVEIRESVRILARFKEIQLEMFSNVEINLNQAAQELGDAIASREVARARELDKYITAMIPFCTSKKVTMKALVQCANLALNTGRHAEAHRILEQVLYNDLLTGNLESEAFLISIDRYLLTAWIEKGADHALRVCDAVLAIFPPDAREQRATLEYQSGMWLIHGGRVEDGIMRLARSIPHLKNPVREPQAKGAVIEGLVLTGAMSLRDGLNSEPHIYPKISTFVWCAMYSEDQKHLDSIGTYLRRTKFKGDEVLPDLLEYSEATKDLIGGKLKLSKKDIIKLSAWGSSGKTFKEYVRRCHLSRLNGDLKNATEHWRLADAQMNTLARGFKRQISEEALHYKNAKLLGITKMDENIESRYNEFMHMIKANGYSFHCKYA